MADEPVQLRGPYAEWRGPYETMTDTQATANAKAAEAKAGPVGKKAEVEAAIPKEVVPAPKDEDEPRRPSRG